MKRKKVIQILTITAVVIGLLAGCGATDSKTLKQEAEASDAGEQAEKEDTDAEVIPDTDAGAEKAETAETEELDTANLPEELQEMVPLMDALNLNLCSYQAKYDCENAELFWNSVQIAAVNSQDWDKYGFQVSDEGDRLIVPKKTAEKFAYAMFGTVKELPELPEHIMIAGETYDSSIHTDENGDFYFVLGDRGLSDYRVNRAIDNGDGTYSIEVSLNSAEMDENEIISFLYTLRESTHDNDLFAYEITTGVPADKKTENKLAGIPYLDIYTQFYGSSIYEEDDIKESSIIEIPYFGTFRDDRSSIESLNDRIFAELESVDETSNENEGCWPEICSYFFTGEDYLQVVSTAIIYPNYATDGDVYSYNYDLKNDSPMTNEDGLKLAGLTEEELLKKVEAVNQNRYDGDSYDHAQLGGFRVKKDGAVDFYLKMFINNELSDNYNTIVTYHTADGSLEYYEGRVLIPDDEIDVMNPPLSHGN